MIPHILNLQFLMLQLYDHCKKDLDYSGSHKLILFQKFSFQINYRKTNDKTNIKQNQQSS